MLGPPRAMLENLEPSAAKDVVVTVLIPLRQGAQTGTLLGVLSLQRWVGTERLASLLARGPVQVTDPKGRVLWRVGGQAATASTHSVLGKRASSVMLMHPTEGPVFSIVPEPESEAFLDGNAPILATLVALAVFGLVMARKLHEQRRSRRVQDALLAQLRKEILFRNAMENSMSTGVRALDLNGRITYVNQAFCKLVGWEENELLLQAPPYGYWPPEALVDGQRDPEEALMRASQAEPFEVKWMRRGGERFDAALSVAPLVDEQGQQIGWMTAAEDITQRKRWQEIEPKIQMGEIAASLAHDLSQPLVAATNFCAVASRMLRTSADQPAAAGEQIKVHVDRASDAIKRCMRVLREIRPYLSGAVSREHTDLRALIEDVVAREEQTLAALEVERPVLEVAVLPKISLDPYMIRSVITNLIRNGVDAMRQVPASQRRIALTAGLTEAGDEVVVAVADRGVGVPDDVKERIFDPSFSTKSNGRGYGLYSCRTMIERHHGKLWVEPNPLGGSIFRFTLPLRVGSQP